MSKPIPVRDQFTQEQKEEVKSLFKQKKTQKEIAEKFGVPRRTIMKLFKHLGLKRDHKQAQKAIEQKNPQLVETVKMLRAKGHSIPQTVSIINSKFELPATSNSAVGRICAKFDLKSLRQQYIDSVDYQAAGVDYNSGMNLKQVSDKYNISTATISSRLSKIGIRIRQPLLPPSLNNKGHKKQRSIEQISLPKFVDSKEWFSHAYNKYGYSTPEIAKYLTYILNIKRTPGYVTSKLSRYGISLRSVSDSIRIYEPEGVLSDYKELGSASKVANKIGCSTQNVLNILRNNNITPTPVSEMFSGDSNPFFGQTHSDEVKQLCRKIGSYYGKKFWVDNPEYIEVVRLKQKLIWSNLEKRAEQSKKISTLRKQGKCNSHKGVVKSRFGELAFDSSYEMLLIEHLENNKNVVNIERDFDLVEYQYNGFTHHFVPDFRVWLNNGEFIVVEVKSKWLQLKPKEHQKIYSAFGKFNDKFLVVDKEFGLLDDRISLLLKPLDFNFKDVELRAVESDDYTRFYAAFHYMGRTGRRGPTLGAYLSDKLIACCTMGSITRKEMADRHDLTQGEVRELVRFCIHPDFHKKNFGSWFISKSVKNYKINNQHVKMLISFADTTHNHAGTIYKAANWVCDGETKPSYHYVDQTGQQYHKKTIWNQAKKINLTEAVHVKNENLNKVAHLPKKRYYVNI